SATSFLPRESLGLTSRPVDPRLETLWIKDDMEVFLPPAQPPAGRIERVARCQCFEATRPKQPHANLNSSFLPPA
ncbi:hypothetical protein KUCAC02_008368, partial [Chaenocephalus aceratus]